MWSAVIFLVWFAGVGIAVGNEIGNSLGFEGDVFLLGDEGYETARYQYGTPSFEDSLMSPGIILYAAGDDDVRKAIDYCRDNEIKMAIRTGGHQYSGFSSTGETNFQLDLSQTYTKYEYDSESNTLISGVSSSLGVWSKKNAELGIYLPQGVCGTVMLGGHVQTGGWGLPQRSWGLLSDRLVAFTIITADGVKRRIVKPTPEDVDDLNDDLWFGVVGGGPSDFGVVAEYEFTPLRDMDHPNSAAFSLVFPFTKGNMVAITKLMVEYTAQAEDGKIPPDYEFFVTTGINGRKAKHMPERIKEKLREKGLIQAAGEEDILPSLIIVDHIYTNKGGLSVAFDDSWVNGFLNAAETPPLVTIPLNRISDALATLFIFENDREFPFPTIKRVQGTRSVSVEWAESYAEKVNELYEDLGTKGLNLLSQLQIYAGGFFADGDPDGLSAHSYRNLTFGYTRDVFYDAATHASAQQHAENWQNKCDKEWLGKEGIYSDEDIRVFWGTYGERDLSKIWQAYFDNDEAKYNRLKRIKSEVDPDGIFTAADFGIRA